MRSFLRGARESVRRLVAFAQAEGWSVDRSAGGHLKLSKIGCASITSLPRQATHAASSMPAPCSVEPTGSVP